MIDDLSRDRLAVSSHDVNPIELFGPEICRDSGCLRLAPTHVACSTAVPDAPGRGRPRHRSAPLSGGPAPVASRNRADRNASGAPPAPATPMRSARRRAMARYRGRHRAPSTTGRTIARTALAGAVAGAPLLAAAPAPTPPPTPPGTAWPSARAAATGTSTPATASTADCSSRPRPGGPSAARVRRRRPPGQPRASRSSWPSGCSPGRAGGPGRSARARPGPRPGRHAAQQRPGRAQAARPLPSPPPHPPRQSATTSSSAATRCPRSRAPARHGRLEGAGGQEPRLAEPEPDRPGPAPHGLSRARSPSWPGTPDPAGQTGTSRTPPAPRGARPVSKPGVWRHRPSRRRTR